MKPTKLFALLTLMAVALSSSLAFAQPNNKKVVAGKVVAVSHEKVTVNTTVLDKITVTVDSCDARGTLKTVHYSPATVSDRTALGHLFDQNETSGRTPNMEAQQQANGFGLFWVDDSNRVLRTGIMGHNVDCKNISGFVSQFN